MSAPSSDAPGMLRLVLPDEAATDALGRALAVGTRAGLYLALQGDLGAGKTALARALLRALGVTGRIRSPSFTLVEPYNPADFPVFHFDLYRFSDADEWPATGFDEHFDGAALCLVEWPERAGGHLRPPDLRALLEMPAGDAPGRLARLEAFTERGRAWLSATAAALPAGPTHAPGPPIAGVH